MKQLTVGVTLGHMASCLILHTVETPGVSKASDGQAYHLSLLKTLHVVQTFRTHGGNVHLADVFFYK